MRWEIARVVRLPMEHVGELRGVIYRTSRTPGEEPKNYVHFFKDKLPTLVTNPSGTRLYIVGGNYRVTSSGIHG
ncbi:MAG TPA: hypothetical protein VGJ66_15235 [Pyrinomonadaceae bacterium]